MTEQLVRYLGPVKAWRGVVGWSKGKGVEICGRVIIGNIQLAEFKVATNIGTTVFANWRSATDYIVAYANYSDAKFILESVDPTPDGFELFTPDGERIKLTVF